MDYNFLEIIPNEEIIVKINSCKELAHRMDHSNAKLCMLCLVDCNQHAMTTLFVYSGSPAISSLVLCKLCFELAIELATGNWLPFAYSDFVLTLSNDLAADFKSG